MSHMTLFFLYSSLKKMKYLYSGDSFGTIKEYNISKLFNSDESCNDSIIEYSNTSIKSVSFIYVDKLDFNGENQPKGGMFIGYSDGTINFILIPLNSNSNIPKITFKVSGEVIFINDVTLKYPNEFDKGNRVIVSITGSKKLYLFRCPHIDEHSEYFQSIIDLDNTNQSTYSNFIIGAIELPCTNIKCATYNEAINSIAFGGYESDIKIVSLDTLDLTWSSKNIKSNMLKHRMPIDVTKLAFIEEDPEILLCGTGYGEIRLYAPKIQRRPIINYVIWEDKSPVTSLEIIKKWGILKSKSSHGSIFALGNNKGSALLLQISNIQVDNHKKLSYCMGNSESALIKKKSLPLIREYVPFNISTKQLGKRLKGSEDNHRLEISTLGSFKGIMGGATTMCYFQLEDKEKYKDCIFLAIGGPGRYIHIFEVKKRRLIKRFFSSQKTTFLRI